MPSPFPGMDPYIEMSSWGGFHSNLAVELQRRINPLVTPRYVARVEERVYLESQYPERAIVPDISLARAQRPASTIPIRSAVAELEPAPYLAALPDERTEPYLELVDTLSNEVVTVIEILSPTNKRRGSDGFSEYRKKWLAVLRSPAHLVEIDLLRAGERPSTMQPLKPNTDYCVLVHRANKRPVIDVYEWPLRRSLPPLPIPLANGDPDVWIDLQSAFETIYEGAGFQFILPYHQPLAPPLRESDQSWAAERLQPLLPRQ